MSNSHEPSVFDELPQLARLFAAQIDAALDEAAAASLVLGTEFHRLASELVNLDRCLDESNQRGAEAKQRCAAMTGSVQTCIVALQFPDALSQRLEHVRTGLALLRELAANPDSSDAWSTLKLGVRGTYSMERERALFDRMMECSGGSSDDDETENGDGGEPFDAKHSL